MSRLASQWQDCRAGVESWLPAWPQASENAWRGVLAALLEGLAREQLAVTSLGQQCDTQLELYQTLQRGQRSYNFV